MEHSEAWQTLFEQVKTEDYSLPCIKLVEVSDSLLKISLPTPSLAGRVKNKFAKDIAALWKNMTGNDVKVEVTLRSAARVPPVFDDGQLIKQRPPARLPSKSTGSAQKPVTMATQIPRPSPAVTLGYKVVLEKIVKQVKQHQGLLMDILPKNNKDSRALYARTLVMYIGWIYLGQRCNVKIGECLNISGASVANTLKRVSQLRRDKKFQTDLAEILKKLEEELGPMPTHH